MLAQNHGRGSRVANYFTDQILIFHSPSMVCKPQCDYTAVDHLCLLLAVQFLFYSSFSFATRWHAVLVVCRYMLLTEPLQCEVPLDPLVKQAALTNLCFDCLFLTAKELFPYFLPILNLNTPAIFTPTLPLSLQFINLKPVTVLNNFSFLSYFLHSHWSVTNGLQGQQIVLLKLRRAILVLTFATTDCHYRLKFLTVMVITVPYIL